MINVKSMATEKIGLVAALAEHAIRACETDLAELIVQLGHDRPSHIVVPAIHKNRAEIREIFLREMGDARADLSDAPRAAYGIVLVASAAMTLSGRRIGRPLTS